MRKVRIITTLLFTVLTITVFGQDLTRQEYIEKYKDLAIKNMREYRIPASITLAQALLESRNGNSELAKKSNNHFGIKCHSSWRGGRTYHDDDKRSECFRVYEDVYDSYADHSDFLQRSRYENCFKQDITDYKSWAKELKKAGYATNPKYPKLLIKIIEDNKLYVYDQIALGEDVEEPELADNSKKSERGSNNRGNDNSGFEDVNLSPKPAVSKTINEIKYLTAKGGETPGEIAHTMEMGRWQIKMYNDVDRGYEFEKGAKVYLQPKKYKGSQKFYIAKKGDSMWEISQRFGIKDGALRRKNRMDKGEEPEPGQKMYLQSKKPKPVSEKFKLFK